MRRIADRGINSPYASGRIDLETEHVKKVVTGST